MHVLTTAPFPHRCAELYESLHEARLWMSAGNTTSSIHFDTHENYMLQLDGSKDVYMYCSSPTAAFHADCLPHCILLEPNGRLPSLFPLRSHLCPIRC
jgi:hypothetical protein